MSRTEDLQIVEICFLRGVTDDNDVASTPGIPHLTSAHRRHFQILKFSQPKRVTSARISGLSQLPLIQLQLSALTHDVLSHFIWGTLNYARLYAVSIRVRQWHVS